MPVKMQLKGEKVNFGCGSRDVTFHGRVDVSGGPTPAYGNGSLLTHPQMEPARPRSVDSAHPPPDGVCSPTISGFCSPTASWSLLTHFKLPTCPL